MTPKIAYIMSRFPAISETAILYEMLELKRLGLHIEIFPLIQQKEPVKHSEVEQLTPQVHYYQLFSPATLTAQFYWLLKKPGVYWRVWKETLRRNLKSAKFLSRSLVVLPLAALYARRMEELDIDHVHAHWATHPTLAAYIIKQLTGIPYSFTAHAADIYVEQTMLEEKIRQAGFVITISEYNRQFLCNLYQDLDARKIHIVHCGINPEKFQPRSSKKGEGPFTIICIARLATAKGHRYLIEACAQLRDQGLDFRCLLVGDGDRRIEIENQIRHLDLTGQISLLGFQPHHKVLELLAEADVMVLPSIITDNGTKEGIPAALMEALAMSLPAVTTATSGIPELIEDGKTGLLVPEQDEQALAAAILKLYYTPDLGRQLADRGRAKVMKEFNLKTSAANLYRLFTKEHALTDIPISEEAIN